MARYCKPLKFEHDRYGFPINPSYRKVCALSSVPFDVPDNSMQQCHDNHHCTFSRAFHLYIFEPDKKEAHSGLQPTAKGGE